MDKSEKRKEISYSYFQNIFNWWTLPILLRWNHVTELEMEDIPDIYTKSGSERLGNEISLLWESELKNDGKGTGLWKVLGRKFGRSFLIVLICLLFQQCVLRLSLPVFLGLLIRFLNGHFTSKSGYCFAAAFALTVFLSSLIFHPCIFELQKMGMQIRIGLTNLIYKKVLRLNQKSLANSGIGQLTNILSNDVNRFDDVMEFIPFVIIGPCQIVFVTSILWRYIGPSCVPGLALLLLLMPIQGFVGKEFGRLRMKVAEFTDRRVSCLTELLSGILLIKMSAWEDTYAENVHKVRKSELRTIQRKNRFAGLNHALFAVSTKMSILLTFLTFVLTDHELSTEAVFVTLSMYNIIALTVGVFLPVGITGISEIVVSIKRIQTILLLEEKELTDESRRSLESGAFVPTVQLESVNGSWGSGAETIKDISFHAESGDLIGIVGSVGSGKSSILQAILHEIPMENPSSVIVLGSVAYASQEPCLFPESIRNNILLGRDYETNWYSQVVDACGLTSDLAMFPFGDETLVGDKGVTLSGGQKARVNLARAVYSQADIYLLDDPLSALDVRVARHVKEKCVDGLLRDKCVILVTHQTHFLRERVTQIISVEKGRINRRGNYEEVFGDGKIGADDAPEPETIAINDIDLDPESGEMLNDVRKQKLETVTIDGSGGNGELRPKAEQELRRQGSVGWKLFWTYFRAGNSSCTIFIIGFITIFTQILQNGSDIWLKFWADKQTSDIHPSLRYGPVSFPYLPFLPHHLEYVELYAGLVGLFFVFSLWRVLSIFSALLSSGAQLHEKLFMAILRAPMSFFQVNSEGLILKLFSNDVGVMDERLPTLIYQVVGTIMQVLGSMAVVSLMSPLLILPTIILVLAIYLIQRIYIRSSGSLKRIEGIARSPVFGHLTTTLSALPTIRAFKSETYFYTKFVEAQDHHSSAFFLYLASFRWLTMTLELVADLYINLVMVYLLATTADSSSFGLALTAALCIINDGTGVVMFTAQLINQMISIERILDYTGIEPEELPEDAQTGHELEVDSQWPRTGDIEFEKVTVAYKNGPNILEDIKLKIKDGEKIGIIGRTGAGKTTLVGALFRIIQPKFGEIRIAGISTQNLALKRLRVKLSIIPQNPVLLAGTLRRNLDPFVEYSDDRIWEVLEVVQLKIRIGECAQGLSYELSEGGLNFSQGERQLISLARTILRQNKILVLDEATANIDTKTDGIIQMAIRERFKESTVLTIAHRLETVMDSDRILVLDGGKIREFDTPSALLSNEDSFLFQLVQKSGPGNAAKLMGMVNLSTN